MRCSRTEAPSLHRRYPASSVVRASPPPCSARPDPRGLSVGACHATGRASRVASIPLVHTCRRHYPGGTGRCSRRSLPDRWQPSPCSGRVGFRITRFEACAAFTSLRPAWSLNRPRRPLSSECFSRCRYLHRPLRLLPAGATVAGRDSHPLRNGAFHGAPEPRATALLQAAERPLRLAYPLPPRRHRRRRRCTTPLCLTFRPHSSLRSIRSSQPHPAPR